MSLVVSLHVLFGILLVWTLVGGLLFFKFSFPDGGSTKDSLKVFATYFLSVLCICFPLLVYSPGRPVGWEPFQFPILLSNFAVQFLGLRFWLRLPPKRVLKAMGLVLISNLIALFELAPLGLRQSSAYVPSVKAKGELRSISNALKSYALDAGTFPAPIDMEGRLLPFTCPMDSTEPRYRVLYEGPSFVDWQLTSPIEALTAIVRDPFSEDPWLDREKRKRENPNALYGYGAIAGDLAYDAFILTSRGPDGESQAEALERVFLSKYLGDTQATLSDPEFSDCVYSPTNGAFSRGDLFWRGYGDKTLLKRPRSLPNRPVD